MRLAQAHAQCRPHHLRLDVHAPKVTRLAKVKTPLHRAATLLNLEPNFRHQRTEAPLPGLQGRGAAGLVLDEVPNAQLFEQLTIGHTVVALVARKALLGSASLSVGTKTQLRRYLRDIYVHFNLGVGSGG